MRNSKPETIGARQGLEPDVADVCASMPAGGTDVDAFLYPEAIPITLLGQNLKKCRDLLDWTQQELADKSHISIRTLSRWNNNPQSRPKRRFLQPVLDTLGMELGRQLTVRHIFDPDFDPAHLPKLQDR
jgi:DNA-binding XRE family transcriptional regulator